MDIRDVDARVRSLAIEIAGKINALRDELMVAIATGGAGITFPWASLSGVPATFPPSSHAHAASDINDFADAVNNRLGDALVAGSGITVTPNGGGTAWTISADAAEALGDTLEAIQALSAAADKLAYFTDTDAAALTDLTAFGRLMIGATLTAAADKLPYLSAADAVSLADLTAFARTLLDDADAATARGTLGAARGDGGYPTESLIVALGDEATAITTGAAKVTLRMPYAFALSEVRASLNTASSSGLVTVDINEGGASILSIKLTIDASEKTSLTAATPAVISDSALADDAEITFDIDTAGTGAKGLKVVLIGRRA